MVAVQERMLDVEEALVDCPYKGSKAAAWCAGYRTAMRQGKGDVNPWASGAGVWAVRWEEGFEAGMERRAQERLRYATVSVGLWATRWATRDVTM